MLVSRSARPAVAAVAASSLRTPYRPSCRRLQSTKPSSNGDDDDEITRILSKPTWSLKSLLPTSSSSSSSPSSASPPSTEAEITPTQLHHLLRLSALPPPSSPTAESSMLRTLSSQIHFVREVQAVDTVGVEPLRAIRDETRAAVQEATIGLESVGEFLGREEVVGRNGRIVWRKTTMSEKERGEEEVGGGSDNGGGWDPLELAQERRGGYFVVRREKKMKTAVGGGGHQAEHSEVKGSTSSFG